VSTTDQSKKKGAAASYRDLVTTSDEAFAFMVLKHHADKWNPPENGNRKRVTGEDKGESMRYYKQMTKTLKEFRSKNADHYKHGEEWYDEMRKKEVGSKKSSTDRSEDDGSASDDDEEMVELEMNPFLQDITTQEQV
jgi:hypothetical protein